MKDDAILSTKTATEPKKFVGARLELRQDYYLSLYVLAKTTNKSEVYRNLLIDWIEETRKTSPEDDLIEEIVERANLQWEFMKKNSENSMTIGMFERKLKRELEGKGLKPAHVSIVLSKIRT